MSPVIIAIIVILGVILLYLISSLIIFAYFNFKTVWKRGEDPHNPCYLRYENYRDFLDRTEYQSSFTYNRAKINGYIYKKKNLVNPKGFFILSHGFFGTHIQYLIIINMLCQKDYVVLAYDQYGAGESEGKNQESLATGIYILDEVINDVTKRHINKNLDIYLYGHSWGGYCVAGVLKNHPEVKKAISLAGFVSPIMAGLDMLKKWSKFLYYFLLPSVYLDAYLLYGIDLMRKSTKGLNKNKDTKLLAIYAVDDDIVLKHNALAIYLKKHDFPNGEFLILPSGGHNVMIANFNKYNELVHQYNELTKIADPDERIKKIEDFIEHLDLINAYELNKDIEKKIFDFLEG